MNKQEFAKLFPFGSHLCREPMPSMIELKHDMELLKKNGFNLIKLQEHWMLDEPHEGLYDFSKYEELISYADKLALGVYLGLTCEQAPNWLWDKHPDARMVRRDGLPVFYQSQSTLPADGKPGPCYDSPGAMDDHLRFIKKLVTTLGKYENIVVFNTWQEVGYWGDSIAGGDVCYCSNTIESYRSWLKKIYNNDIMQLNEHWNVRYIDFYDIYPDRLTTRKNCIPQNIFYHYFMDNVQVANVLKARYQAIKESDPFNRPIFAHKGSPAKTSGMDWTYARTQDFLGTSSYPAWEGINSWDDVGHEQNADKNEYLYNELWNNIAYSMDYIRCANKPGAPIWAAEYQGGPISTDFHLGRKPDADDMRRWMFTTMGAGATAISFWITRAEIMAPETNGFSLLDSEGDTTERFEEVSRIGCALNEYAPLFLNNNRQAEVAILIDEWKYQLMNTFDFAKSILNYDIRGWYKILWDMNIPCDFIEASQLNEGRTNNYKAIVSPMPLFMSDSVAKDLADYVEKGGNVILEAAPGRLNEVGFAVRGEINPVLRKILGITQKEFIQVDEPGKTDRWSQRKFSWGGYADACFLDGEGLFDGCRLRANMILQTFECMDSRVIFRAGGHPAGVYASHGKGSFLLVGTYIGPSGTAYCEEDTPHTIKTMLNLYGVTSLHEGKLLFRKRVQNDKEAWFITNPHKEAIEETFTLDKGYKAIDLMGEQINISKKGIMLTVNSLDVRVLIINKL